jgi:peptide/nickel transport system ATP-binding protein
MYLGSIVEIAPAQRLFEDPQHPYSMALLSSVLEPGGDTAPGEQIVLKGELPSPSDIPTGCPFSSRCWLADDHCRSERPALTEQSPDHLTACHKAGSH